VIARVPLTVVGWVSGIAVLLLLGDEGPLLIERDLAGSGGKTDQLIVEVAGMISGDPAQSTDGPPIHLAEPSGLADAAPLVDVLQDRFDLLGRQPRVEQGRLFAFGESGFANAATEHASGLRQAIAAGHDQISGPPLAMLGVVRIPTAEAREVVRGAAPPSRSSRLMVSYVIIMG
jgi:hypothetical protein